jgi:putative membrane protein
MLRGVIVRILCRASCGALYESAGSAKGSFMKVLGVWLITALAIAAAVWLVPGLEFLGTHKWFSMGILAAILALLNAFIKPILQVISLPITVITLGIFALIVNTGMLYLAAWLSEQLFDTVLHIDNFGSAFVASIVISIATALLNALTGIKSSSRGSRSSYR